MSKAALCGAVLAVVLAGIAVDSRAQTPPVESSPSSSSSSPSPSSPSLSPSSSGAPDWVILEWSSVPPPGTFTEMLELDRQREELANTGQHERLIPVLRKLVLWNEKTHGADHADTLQRVMWLASAERTTGAWSDSERHYRQVLSSLERTRQTRHVHYRIARRGLIELLVDKGDYERAEPIAAALLADAEAADPQGATVAEALRGLAHIRRARGALADAEALLLRALAGVLAHGEPAARSYRSTLDAKGREVDVTTESQTRRGEGPLLGDLTLLLVEEGKLADAEKYGRRSVAANEELGGPVSLGVAYATHDLGRVLLAKGDAAGAWQAFAGSLAIREKGSGIDHPVVATVLHSMARLRLAQGAGAEAEALGKRALAIVEKAYGVEHRRVADVLEDIAQALVEQGRAREALPFEDRASAIRDREAQIVLAVGSEAQRRVLAAGRRKQTDATLSLASAADLADPAARLALRTLLRAKGRLLDASADEVAALRGGLDDAGRAVFDDLARVTAALSASAARGETAEASPEARDRLARLAAERRRLEGLIADRSAAYRADEALPTVEDVARRVPEDAALVEVAAYRPFLLRSAKEPRPDATTTPWGDPRYAAYVLRGGEVSAVDLGPAAEVDAAVTKLRAALGDPDLTHDARPAGREAYDRIFAPIAAKLGGVAHVLWSPDGALSLVPLGALVAPDGRWLVESRLYTYVTSGRDLLRFEAPATPRSGPLVIAAPDFGPLPGKPVPAASRRGFEVIEAPHPGGGGVEASRPGGAGVETSRPGGAVVEASHPGGAGVEASHRSAEGIDMSRIGFLPLPGTAREADAVERTLAGGARLVGDKATESAVKWAHAPSVLHIATHGFFLPDAPIAAASAAANASGGAAGGPMNAADGAATGVAPGLEASGSEAALAVQAESPLVRSGLAFAGANQRASGSEDGILSGLEASTLDLAGTELVVLSACETGLGAAVPGDGVYGLRRAFAIAGAETLVMSLWQVDTGRTRELMTAYYEALATGAGRGEAMRRAQLGMLANEATAHPNLWASFIVSGRWTPLTATKLVAPPKLDPGPRGCACDVGVGLPAWSERASSEPAASDRIPNEQTASVRGPNARTASARGPNERAPGEGTVVLAALALAGWRLRRLSPRRHTRRAG